MRKVFWCHILSFRHSLTFDMQHDIGLKKLNFGLSTPRVRRGSAGKIFATIKLHFVIPFK